MDALFAGLSLADLWPLIMAMMGAGAIAGVLAGFLGVGGGIILVPILFYVFGALGMDEAVRMHLAVGTSLATIIPTSIRSVTKHHAQAAVDWAILRNWMPAIVVGVVLGSLAASAIAGQALSLIFGIMALMVAAHLAFSPEHIRLADTMPGEPIRGVIGGGIGFLSTLMGIGGGTFSVTVMTLYGQPIHRAIGTASGLGLAIAVPATLGFIWAGQGAAGLPPLSLGFVNLIAFAFIIPMTWVTVPIGVALAHRLDRTTLRRAFAVFLGMNATLMILDAVVW